MSFRHRSYWKPINDVCVLGTSHNAGSCCDYNLSQCSYGYKFSWNVSLLESSAQKILTVIQTALYFKFPIQMLRLGIVFKNTVICLFGFIWMHFIQVNYLLVNHLCIVKHFVINMGDLIICLQAAEKSVFPFTNWKNGGSGQEGGLALLEGVPSCTHGWMIICNVDT